MLTAYSPLWRSRTTEKIEQAVGLHAWNSSSIRPLPSATDVDKKVPPCIISLWRFIVGLDSVVHNEHHIFDFLVGVSSSTSYTRSTSSLFVSFVFMNVSSPCDLSGWRRTGTHARATKGTHWGMGGVSTHGLSGDRTRLLTRPDVVSRPLHSTPMSSPPPPPLLWPSPRRSRPIWRQNADPAPRAEWRTGAYS
jgi:hypothetical protein